MGSPRAHLPNGSFTLTQSVENKAELRFLFPMLRLCPIGTAKIRSRVCSELRVLVLVCSEYTETRAGSGLAILANASVGGAARWQHSKPQQEHNENTSESPTSYQL